MQESDRHSLILRCHTRRLSRTPSLTVPMRAAASCSAIQMIAFRKACDSRTRPLSSRSVEMLCPSTGTPTGENHTFLVLGGPEADAEQVLETKRALDTILAGSAMVDAVLGFCVERTRDELGQMDPSVAEQLGFTRVTVLAIRPDRYVGFRLDDGDPANVENYLEGLIR